MASTSSITMQSLGKIVQRTPAVGAKTWCLYVFYFSVTLRGCSFDGDLFEQVLCRGLWVDFDNVYAVFQQ